MHKTNFKTKKIELIPAVLAKTRQELLDSINKVKKYVKTVHIDVMDNKFVPNLTIGLKELKRLPKNIKYEFHWMVENPEEWIEEIKGNHPHLVHMETITDWKKIKKTVKEAGGRIGLALNPETSIKKITQYIENAEEIKGIEPLLVMTVHPGFSGQKYIKKMEKKISYLRKKFPKLNIEVDGGVDPYTAISAVKAGANKIAAASAIFNSRDIKQKIRELKKIIGEKNANQNHKN